MITFERLSARLPDAAQHLEWIESLCNFGIRRPGTSENADATQWCAATLAAMGYDVELQPVRALTTHPGRASLTAWCADRPTHRIQLDGLTMPFTSSCDRRQFRLEVGGEANRANGDRSEVATLQHVQLTELPVSVLDNAILARHDPSGEFADHVHVLPFGNALGKEIDVVVESQAGAMVGVIDAPWVTADYFVPYDGVVRPIPALWLSREAGAELERLLADGEVDVEITTRIDHRESVDHNVIATAPSPSCDDWIVVGSHHDAPWASAVEDASGVAQVLAQASAWSTIPPADRPASLAFVLTAAHMSHGAGTREFIASWPYVDRIRFALHLEHIAAEAVPDGAGGLRASDRAEVRWWFASAPEPDDFDAIVGATAAAVAEQDLDRSLVLPPETFGPMPPTDGGFFHPAGVPMVNLLAAPMYLFDPADTTEMVHQPSLEPTARAALRLTCAAAAGWPSPVDGPEVAAS